MTQTQITATDASFVNLPESCRRARVSYQRAYRCIVSGMVPAKRVGHGWHIAVTDIPALAAAAASLTVRHNKI